MFLSPEYFIEPFIREGVIENIKSLHEIEENAFLDNIVKRNSFQNYNNTKFTNNYGRFIYENEFYNNEYLYKYSDLINEFANENNINENNYKNSENIHNESEKVDIDINLTENTIKSSILNNLIKFSNKKENKQFSEIQNDSKNEYLDLFT